MNLPARFIVTAFLPLLVLSMTGCRSFEPKEAFKLPSVSVPNLSVPSATEVYDGVQQTFASPEPNREIALASFAEGEKTFNAAAAEQAENRTATFRQAVKPYKLAAENAPKTTIEEDALLMIAESHFFADEYVKAAEAYDELIAKYPRTRHLDKIDQRRFATSQHWLKRTKEKGKTSWLPNFTDRQLPASDTFGYATKNFDKIRFDNPTGKLADDATMAAAIANFEKRKFGQADILFSDIRDNFPNSEHQFQAHFLGLKCKQELYRGPDYSGVMLDEGEKIIRQIYKAFPEQARAQHEQLQAVYKDIRLKQATRDYSLAQYYDNRGEFGAAKLYYDNVTKDFKDTNLSLESEDRVNAIRELPETPRESLKWLSDLFPEEEHRTKPLLKGKTLFRWLVVGSWCTGFSRNRGQRPLR